MRGSQGALQNGVGDSDRVLGKERIEEEMPWTVRNSTTSEETSIQYNERGIFDIEYQPIECDREGFRSGTRTTNFEDEKREREGFE